MSAGWGRHSLRPPVRQTGCRSGRRARRCPGDPIAPAIEGGVEVERSDLALLPLLLPVLRGDPPHDLELDAIGVFGVERLGYPVVAGADRSEEHTSELQ